MVEGIRLDQPLLTSDISISTTVSLVCNKPKYPLSLYNRLFEVLLANTKLINLLSLHLRK